MLTYKNDKSFKIRCYQLHHAIKKYCKNSIKQLILHKAYFTYTYTYAHVCVQSNCFGDIVAILVENFRQANVISKPISGK